MVTPLTVTDNTNFKMRSNNSPNKNHQIPGETSNLVLDLIMPLIRSSKFRDTADLCSAVQNMLSRANGLGVKQVFIHDDEAANQATKLLGVKAFCLEHHIYLHKPLIRIPYQELIRLLKHEFVHVVQVQRGLATNIFSSTDDIEQEADQLDILSDDIFDVRAGARCDQLYNFWWFIPIAVGLYLAMKPNVANAPGPDDKTYKLETSEVAGEMFAIIFMPEAAFNVAGRLGWGFYRASALAGASASMSLQATQDIRQGKFSGVQVYIFDGITGAAVGVIVPGGIRWFGQTAVKPIDWLATQGMRRSDIALGKLIQSRIANTGPLTSEGLNSILQSRNIMGQASDWWLNRRGQILLYRGQEKLTNNIISPLARGGNGIAASEELVARMRELGISDSEIARYTAQWYTQKVPGQFTIPELAGKPLGAVGIPTTQLPGVAAGFENSAVVYIIRVPKGAAIKVPPWGLAVEKEWVILNQIPKQYIVDVIPANRLPALKVDDLGRLVLPGTQ